MLSFTRTKNSKKKYEANSIKCDLNQHKTLLSRKVRKKGGKGKEKEGKKEKRKGEREGGRKKGNPEVI